MQGWIKLHRKIAEWEWYTDGNTFRVFIHLLIHANYKDKRYKGILIKRGQILTGRKSLATALELTERQVRTALTKLKKSQEIDQQRASKTTKSGSIITICNYESYQEKESDIDQENDQQNDQETTSRRPTSDQQATTNKNVKKEKNVKNERENEKNLSTQNFQNSKAAIAAPDSKTIELEIQTFYKSDDGFESWKEIVNVLDAKIPNKSVRNKKVKEMISAMSRQYVLRPSWDCNEDIKIKHTRFLDWIARERSLN